MLFSNIQICSSLSISKACEFLNEKMPEDIDINDALTEFQLIGDEVFKDIQKIISKKSNSSVGVRPFSLNNHDDNDDDNVNDLPNGNGNQATSNSRGTRGGRDTTSKSRKTTATKTTTPSRGRGASRGGTRAAAGTSARNTSVCLTFEIIVIY